MKRIFTLILSALMLTLVCGQAYAQKNKSGNDYNLQKAYEVLNEEKDETKGLDLVNKQLQETPDNVEALLLSARLNRRKGEYGTALSAINHALKVNKPKKTEIAMSTLHWWKGSILTDMNDYEKAVEPYRAAYQLARKDNRDNLQSISFEYGCTLAYLDRLDEADEIFNAMLKEDDSDAAAMVGLASTAIKRKDYRGAADILEKARGYAESYAEIYRFQMKAYRALGEQTKAIDAAMDYFEKADDPVRDSVVAIMKLRPNYAVATAKARAKKSDEPLQWKYLLAIYYENTRDYAAALHELDEMEQEYGKYDQITFRRSSCYEGLGLFDRSVEELTRLIEKDSNWYLLVSRGDSYRLCGRIEDAIADFTAAIDEAPNEAYAYYKRGWCYEMKGEKGKAMEDYNLGIDMSEDYPYLYLMRGTLLMENGDREAADRDFEAVLQKDTIADNGSCRQYALHYLGRDGEAREWMNKIIASDPDAPGNYYVSACLLARMGCIEESVDALKTAFEKGYRSFSHIELDDDMDPIRDEPEFKSLIREYRAKHDAYLKESDIAVPSPEATITEIDMVRKPGGTFEIPCDINGLSLQMIFDTGASDVTISSVEANFMLKNGYLSDKDIKGKRYYQVASGDLSEGTVITLREVKVGDAVLRNVDASVVKSQKAPLLLGQSAMERFGTITIDNINGKLVIKH